ncbi:MAG: hypothetical protein ACR2LI_02160 [Propionibacteriaceae bacterium]
MGWTLLVLLYVAAGVAAAWEARRKGHDDLLFLVIGVVLGPIALIGMWFLPRTALAVGTPVRPAAKITLDDGRIIPTRHVSVVRAAKVIDGEQVCLITAPSGTQHWVAQEALSRLRSVGG